MANGVAGAAVGRWQFEDLVRVDDGTVLVGHTPHEEGLETLLGGTVGRMAASLASTAAQASLRHAISGQIRTGGDFSRICYPQTN